MPIASALRSALLVFGLALTALVSPALLAQASTAADGFNPNAVDGNVYAVALQSDGKVLIAGSFQHTRPNGATSDITHNRIARVLADGRDDPTFVGDVNDQINAMVLQADGKIVIGGKFTKVGATDRSRIARLNVDGSLDTSFNPSVDVAAGGSLVPEVSALAVQSDGKIVAGGGFTNVTLGTAKANYIIRFNSDGTADTAFNPNANGMVLSLAVQADQQILVGGGFTTLQGLARNRIARVSAAGVVDATFDPSANNAVTAIEVLPSGRILIGGSFTVLQPNGGSTYSSGVDHIAQLEATGTVSTTGGNIDFGGSVDGPVAVIKRQADGRILIGGSFGTVGALSRSYLARLYPSGSPDTTFAPEPNFTVNALAVQPNGSIVLGGTFITLRGTGETSVVRNHVARISPFGALDADFRPDLNGRLRSIGVQSDGKVLVGGSFSSVAGETHSGIVRLNTNGSLDSTFNTSLNGGVVAAVQQADGKIVISGAFTRVNGAERLYLARLNPDGTLDATYNPAPDNQVNTLLLQSDGKVIIGGSFNTLRPDGITAPVTHSRIARINVDGTLDLSYGTQTDNVVWTLVAQPDGKVLVGGGFTGVLPTGSTVGKTRRGIARLNADGTLDTVFDPTVNGTVDAIAVQSDGKIVFGGNFQQLAPNSGGVAYTRNRVARVNADGTIDLGFDPNINGFVSVLAIQDGKILVGGNFSAVQPNGATSGTMRNYVARFNADGSLDDSFNLFLDVLPGNEVLALTVTPAGILVGGTFSVIGNPGIQRDRIARVLTSGAVDQSFKVDASLGAGAPIAALTVQYDGQIFAAGSFAPFNGTGSANIARFNADGVPDRNFVPNVNGPVYSIAESAIKGAPVATQHAGFARVQSNGQLQTSFVLGAEVTVMAGVTAIAVQPDKKVLIAATFTISGTSASLARFNPDGSVDADFKLKTSGTINTIKVLSDQKILIGGTFSNLDSLVRNNIARLNSDGTIDTTFSVAADNTVSAIALQSDGKMVIGGAFSSVAGSGSTTYTNRGAIARINSDLSLDTDFNPTANGAVRAIIVQSDGKLVVGGGFTTFKANGATTTTTRRYLARLNGNGTLDESIDLNVNGEISAMALQADNKIVVSGSFTSIGNKGRNYLARLDSNLAVEEAFNPNPNAVVLSVAVQTDGKILIGGAFTALQPGSTNYDPAVATPRNRAARLNVDGTVDATFNPNFDSSVGVLIPADDNSVIAGGSFTAIQPTGSLFVAGAFSAINGVESHNLALLGGDGSVSSAFAPQPNGAVYAMLPLIDGRLIAGGAFTKVYSTTDRNHLVRFTATNELDAAFNPNADGDVYAVALQADGKLVVGGSFNNIGGGARSNLARLNADGSLDGSFAASVAGAVHAVMVQADGAILITRATGTGTNVLERLNANGSKDNSFNPANDGVVNSVAVQADGKITVGGSFVNIAGTAKKYLARLNSNGTLDTSVVSEPNGPVTALALQRDGKILIGGTFGAVDGLPRFGLARIATSAVATESFSSSGDRTTLTWTRGGAAPEVSAVQFESSSDGFTWTVLGAGSRIAGTSNWQIAGLTALSSSGVTVRASAITPVTPNTSAGLYEARGYVGAAAVSTVPSVTGGQVSTASGSSFFYRISSTGSPTSFNATGLPAGLTVNTTTGVISGTATQMGTFSVVLTATNASGSSSTTLTLIVGAPGSTTTEGRIVNLSVNAQVSAANPLIIAGFVIAGPSSQNLLLRAVGPGLTSLSVTGVLATPTLKLLKGSVVQDQNSQWGGGSDLVAAFQRLGAFPLTAGSADAALLVTLAPGAYTMHVSDAGTAGGVVLAEVYDAQDNPPPAGSPHLVNLSARGVIASAGQLVTGGFVVNGSTSKKILIRGIGPGLTAQGVVDVLANPKVTLNQIASGGAATVIARNDDWGTADTVSATYPAASAAEISAAATATGAFALTSGSLDSAVLITLAPGVYTAGVGSSGTGTGAAMVEIYEVP